MRETVLDEAALIHEPVGHSVSGEGQFSDWIPDVGQTL